MDAELGRGESRKNLIPLNETSHNCKVKLQVWGRCFWRQRSRFLDLDWLMPSLTQVIKWCILSIEELYCLPGLQQNFGICCQADRGLLWPTGKPLSIWVSCKLLKIPIDSLLWSYFQNLRRKCFTLVQTQRWLLDGAWMKQTCLTVSAAALPSPPEQKELWPWRAIYFLSCPLPPRPLSVQAVLTIISLHTPEYLLQSLYLTQRFHNLGINLGCLIWQTPISAN